MEAFGALLRHGDVPSKRQRPFVGERAPQEELQTEGVQPPRGNGVRLARWLYDWPHAVPGGKVQN